MPLSHQFRCQNFPPLTRHESEEKVLPFPLVPKLRLGNALAPKLCFFWMHDLDVHKTLIAKQMSTT